MHVKHIENEWFLALNESVGVVCMQFMFQIFGHIKLISPWT